MNLKEVCRLCLVNNNLLWIFDQRFESNNHMKDLIFKTIGIQINQEDVISQKICHKCAEDVVKLYEFRKQSIKNDLYLKEQHKKMNQNICFTENISPMVEMNMDEVESYFKKEKRNFKRHVQQVLRQERDASTKSKISTETVSPISIRFREDKSCYEIVHKESNIQSDPIINKKRQLSDSESNTSKRVRNEFDSIQPEPIKRQSIGPIDLNSSNVSSLDQSLTEITENGNATTKGKPKIISNILNNPLENLIRPISQLNLESTSTNTTLSNEDFHYLESTRNMNTEDYPEIHEKEQSVVSNKESYPNIISNNTLINKHELDCNCKETFSSKDIYETCYKRKVPVENIDHNQNLKKTDISEVIEICSEDEEEIKPVMLDVHPHIQIKDSRFPIKNYNSSTHDILNKLLVFDKNESPSDKNPQTDLTSENPELNRIISDIKHVPKKDSIICENNGLIVNINNLKFYMHKYKVPVYINHGEKLDAKYNCEESKKPSKTYKDWNHLTPINLVINAKKNDVITKSIEVTDSLEIRQIPNSIETSNVPNAKILDTSTTNEKVTTKNSISIDEKIKQLEINNIKVSKDPPVFNEVNANLPEEIFASHTNIVDPLRVVNTVNSPRPIVTNNLVESSINTNNNQSNNVSMNAQVGYIVDSTRPEVITSTNQLHPNDISSSIPQMGCSVLNNIPNIYLSQPNYFSNMLVQHKENSELNHQVPYSNFNHQLNDFYNYGNNNMNVYNQPNLNNSHIIMNRTWVPPHLNSIQSGNTLPSMRPPPPTYNAYNNNTLPSFQQKNLYIPKNRTVNCASRQNNIHRNVVSRQYTKNCVTDFSNNLTVNNKKSSNNCQVRVNQDISISDIINNTSIRVRPLSDLK